MFSITQTMKSNFKSLFLDIAISFNLHFPEDVQFSMFIKISILSYLSSSVSLEIDSPKIIYF